jgi:hypothetical protein
MRLALLLIVTAAVLGACQSSSTRRADLARICADPANRAPTPGNLYYDECQSLHPSSPAQLEKVYQQTAPE